MVGEPERGLGDEGGELLQFDAVELVDVDAGDVADVEVEGELLAVVGAEEIEFEGAEFAVGDDEKIAAAAGGIEETQRRELLVKLSEGFGFRGGGAELGEFGFEVVEEERVEDAADIFLGGVVGAFGAALLLVHHALEEGAEDGGRDAAPVETAAGEEGGAVTGAHVGDIESLGEEAAVDVGEGGELG